MHVLGDAVLGGLMLCLLAALVAAKWRATGSVLDERPDARPLVSAVNALNLGFLLVVNPLVAVLLLAGRLGGWDVTRVEVPWVGLRAAVEAAGVAIYVAGAGLMAWALLTLSRSYQLGGMVPRPRDQLVTGGPYALMRHPMYAAALALALGLAMAVESVACVAVFGAYLVLLRFLMPVEEAGLRSAYGGAYDAYARTLPRLVPHLRHP